MWLLPTTSCRSVPASAASISESELLFQALARSAWSRGKPMQPQYWARAWRKAGFIRRLSGWAILENSTPPLGVAAFIASLPEIHASPTPSQESVKGPMTTAGSSTRYSGSSRACGLIVSSGRTSRGTRTDSLQHSSRHWKQWATALRQEYSARQKWEQATGASDCSSWPTARVSRGAYTRDNGDPAKECPSLEGLAEQWETPSVAVTEGSRLTRGGKRSNEMLLTGQAMAVSEAKDWATPCARDHFPPHTAEYIAGKKAQGHGMRNLVDEATAWPTPAARATKGANSADHLENGTGRKHLDQLPNFVSHCLPPDHPTRSGPTSSDERRSLNPLFVEWLMGWPIGWTALEPVAMAWSHYRQLTHGELSKLASKNSERTLFGEIAA